MLLLMTTPTIMTDGIDVKLHFKYVIVATAFVADVVVVVVVVVDAVIIAADDVVVVVVIAVDG